MINKVTNNRKKPSRKEQILQSLATLLEQHPGGRITTASLARHVGVSEAALYRHFPSKAKMFDDLIEFIETSIFTRINIILSEEEAAEARCRKILSLILTFCERNPGITRIMTGDPLSGETTHLRVRVAQLFDRIETQLRQVLREMALRQETAVTQTVVKSEPTASESSRPTTVTQALVKSEPAASESSRPTAVTQALVKNPAATANLLLAVVEGRISQYVRSDFTRCPTEQWDEQWETLRRGLF